MNRRLLAAIAFVVMIAPAALAHHVPSPGYDYPQIHGRHPAPTENVLVACNGDHTGSFGCWDVNWPAQYNFWHLRVSTCASPEQFCSKFTGTLRITIEDGITADEIRECDFTDGLVSLCWSRGGDGFQYWASSLTVDVIPLVVHGEIDISTGIPPSGGDWYVWFLQTN